MAIAWCADAACIYLVCLSKYYIEVFILMQTEIYLTSELLSIQQVHRTRNARFSITIEVLSIKHVFCPTHAHTHTLLIQFYILKMSQTYSNVPNVIRN